MIANLKKAVLLGLAATLILSFIEWVDLNVRLTPVFASFSERLIFTAYLSLNLFVGSVIGLILGLLALAAAFLNRTLQSRGVHKLISAIVLCAVAGALLNQQPDIHGYVQG